ncbi:MAG: extracellular solute-binding protein [Verrucomicrobiae bacterium]|nr:extracellular solute-binding protein [Verrucomicrobiae bacterium]
MSTFFKTSTKSDQLHDFLKKEIQREAFKPTQRIPSERDLAERFQLSRLTVHKVFSNLVTEGILYRKQGQGTFVSPKASKKQTLSICMLSPSLPTACMNVLFNQFENQYPHIVIKAHHFSTSEIGNVQFWARQPDFDLIMVGESVAPFMIQQEFLEDLTDKINIDLPMENFHSTPVPVFTSAGRSYAVPFVSSPVVLLCNCRLFAEAGIPIESGPMEWDDFLAKAKRLTVPEKGQYGFAFSNHRNRWPVLLMKRGACLFDEKGSFRFHDGPVRDAFQWFHDLVYRHHVAPSPLISISNLFATGKAAMYMGTGYCMPGLNNKESFEYAIIPLPGEISASSGLVSMAFGIHRDSPRKETAWDFIKLALSEKFQSELYSAGYALPRRKIERFDANPKYQTLARELVRGKPLGSNPDQFHALDFLTEHLKLFWSNMAPLGKTLDEAERQITENKESPAQAMTPD